MEKKEINKPKNPSHDSLPEGAQKEQIMMKSCIINQWLKVCDACGRFYVNLEQHEESSCYFDSQIDDDKLADGELVEHRLGDTI